MAFASKIGSFLRQSISSHTSSNGTTSMPSIYQALRNMSSSRLFIGGLSYGIDEQILRETFTEFGEITEARIIYDRESGRSRGFGFVSFVSNEEAAAAIQGVDGKQLSGRIVHVNYATERRGGFGGGYGSGGGYSQGGGYGSGGGYSQSGGYGSGGGNYSQNDSYGSGSGSGDAYNQNDRYGSGGGSYSQNAGYGSGGGYTKDQYGNGGGYSQNSYSQSQNEHGTGSGYSQNDGYGSGNSGVAAENVGYDNEPHDNASNMGKGY